MNLHTEYIPGTGPVPASGAALVMIFHGLGDSNQGWRPAVPMIVPAGAATLLVQAPMPYPPDSPFGWSWFDLDRTATGLQVDQAQITAHRQAIDTLISQSEVEPERIALVGFSQGGLMALEVALHGEHLLSGVVSISGWVANPAAALGEQATLQRIFASVGTQDGVVPAVFSEAGYTTLIRKGVDLRLQRYVKEHTLVNDEAKHIRSFLSQG